MNEIPNYHLASGIVKNNSFIPKEEEFISSNVNNLPENYYLL
jgi:hypothetical protein